MNYLNFRKKEISRFNPVLSLEKIFSDTYRRFLNIFINILIILFIILICLYLFEFYTQFSFGSHVKNFLNDIGKHGDIMSGILLLLFVFKIKIFSLNSFYNHFYLENIDSVLEEYKKNEDKSTRSVFEVASILKNTTPKDVTGGFLKSKIGERVFLRCGIAPDEVEEFQKGKRKKVEGKKINTEIGGKIDLKKYSEIIYNNDKSLKQFLSEKQIQKEDFLGAASFVDHANKNFKEKKRWWSKRRLNKIKGIAKEWSYGKIFLLKKYGRAIEETRAYKSVKYSSFFGDKEVEKIETILSRENGANVMFIGDYDAPMFDILSRISLKIKKDKTSNYLKEKKLFVIDGNALVSLKETSSEFESKFISVLNQASKAGNIVLIFENFVSLLNASKKMGSDVVSILKKYLNSRNLHVVALVDSGGFHSQIEGNSKLMVDFEKIFFTLDDSKTILKIIQDKALALEYRYGVLFTYPSLQTIAESAERYFASGILADKAIDLVLESVSFSKARGKRLINREMVSDLVESKTGVPLGNVNEKEKEKLLGLEEKMHEWVIGQEKAVSKIAESLRRARTGIGSNKKPIGTFLFMGPTGVGKTHTTKTLAKVYFGRESNMMRLDMSEYAGSDALARLIGSFSNPSGTLTSLIREKKYGVLLLDEFEKTNPEVHDLFLQILDEGIFSDYKGKKVSARNLIIIATSNAGSKLIWEMFESGESVIKNEDRLLDEIISKGIFKTELINRFDGVIVFHPLEREHLKKIAKILLKGLNKRLGRKGVEIEIDDSLISYVVENGYDPQFGARPMKRVIQEKIEHTIAEKMLRGEVKSGMKVKLNNSDLE